MELAIVNFFNQLGQGTKVDSFLFFISWIPIFLSLWFILALASLIFDKKNGKWVFLGFFIVATVYYFFNDLIIKQTMASIFFRERPYIAFPEAIISSGEMWIDSSFPSGHMAITLSFATLFVYFYRRWWAYGLAILLVLIIAIARLHNGMHFPSDVVAGMVLGIGYGFLGILVLNKIRFSRQKN